jgi:hypothetical protein
MRKGLEGTVANKEDRFNIQVEKEEEQEEKRWEQGRDRESKWRTCGVAS